MIEMLTKVLWAALGAAAGYYVAKRQLHDYYEERLHREVENARYFFEEKYEQKLKMARLEGALQATADADEAASAEFQKDGADLDGDTVFLGSPEAAEKAAKALTNYQGISEAASTLAQELAETSVATESSAAGMVPEQKGPDFGDAAEALAEKAGPRLINFTMYDANEHDYAQETVLYFADGGVVVDANDNKLSEDRVKRHIGDYNLEQLNPNRTTIYVRNDRYRVDFEVIYSPNSFEAEVGSTG